MRNSINRIVQGVGVVGLIALIQGCACQDLAKEAPDDSAVAGKSVMCGCTIKGSGPLGAGSQEHKIEFEACVPEAFEDNPEEFCTSDEYKQFLSTAGLAIAEDEDSRACSWVNIKVEDCAAVPRGDDELSVQAESSCAGTCQTIVCNDDNCSVDQLKEGSCDCTAPSACDGFSEIPVCTPSFEGGIVPAGLRRLSAEVGGRGLQSVVAMSGTWDEGSTLRTEVDARGCFLFICKEVSDSATANVRGKFSLFGTPCAGTSCNLGFSAQASVSTFELDLDELHTISDMYVDVLAEAGSLTVDADGNGEIPPDTLVFNAEARDNGVRKVIRRQMNEHPVPFSVDWSTRELSIRNLRVDFPEDEGAITVNLKGYFGESFREVLIARDADGDGVSDVNDNCPLVPNPQQEKITSPVITPSEVAPSCNAPELIAPQAEDICFALAVELKSDSPAEFAPGSTVVTWTATDAFGTQTTATQDVIQRAALVASGGITLEDRAQVGGPVAAIALGTQGVTIGTDASISSVISVGPIVLRDRAEVSESLWSAGSITLGNQTRTSQAAITANTPIRVAEFPGLASFDVNASGPTVHLEPGQHRAISPGTYSALIVKSGSTLALAPGDYALGSLQLEPGSKLVLQGNTTFYIGSSLILRGEMTGPGAVALAYAGTNELVLESNFGGVVHAPEARVVLGTGDAMEFTGNIVARDIVVRPGVSFVCED